MLLFIVHELINIIQSQYSKKKTKTKLVLSSFYLSCLLLLLCFLLGSFFKFISNFCRLYFLLLFTTSFPLWQIFYWQFLFPMKLDDIICCSSFSRENSREPLFRDSWSFNLSRMVIKVRERGNNGLTVPNFRFITAF